MNALLTYLTFQLHFAALSSLKTEINDLQKQVKKVTSERDAYRRTLKESRDEKDRLIVKYEERLHEQEQQVTAMWFVCEFLIFCCVIEIFRILASNTKTISSSADKYLAEKLRRNKFEIIAEEVWMVARCKKCSFLLVEERKHFLTHLWGLFNKRAVRVGKHILLLRTPLLDTRPL